jgi:hypothetical protein
MVTGMIAEKTEDSRRRARIVWIDNQTGRTGVYTDSRECPTMHATGDGDGFEIFWWAEGNASCDCNRAIFFLGQDLGEVECGDGRFTIERLDVLDHDDSVLMTFDASYFSEVSQ